MFAVNYKHNIIRKCTIAFGNLFKDIAVERNDTNGNRTATIPVPLAYGPKDKFASRVTTDPNLNDPVAMQLPRMGFELTSLSYDGTRKINSLVQNRVEISSDYNKLLSQYTPVPYNIDFTLSIMVKNADDGVQIVEQILPYFTPDYNVTINMIPSMGITMDVPIILTSVTSDDTYEGDFESRRILTWTLSFTMKAYIYGPIKKTGIIKTVQVDSTIVTPANSVAGITSSDLVTTSRSSRVITTPGLTSDGLPTTDPTESIPVGQIKPTDDFGFATDINQYYDGKKFNPITGIDEIPPFNQ